MNLSPVDDPTQEVLDRFARQAVDSAALYTDTIGDTKLPKIVVADSTPGRVLDVAFQPSLTNPCLVFYTVELQVTAPLMSSQDVTVDLFSDELPDPVTRQGQAYLKSSQLAGLSLVSIQTTARQQLTAYVPAGNYVELATSGSGIATLVSQLELEFNG